MNASAYGFQYPAGADYNFFLPLANWLRNPSLYPGDALRTVFPHVQTFYWPVVALLSRYFRTEHILFAFFVLTKLVFFGAAGRLVALRVPSRPLGICMIAAIALSGMLNNQTPFGGTIILDEISEHAALGLALALLAGVLLVEGRWLSAAIVAGLIVYVDALQFVHLIPALAWFAMMDWREQKRGIISAAVLGAAIFLPWYIYFHRSYLTDYPAGYVSVLLLHYPLHIALRWTPVSNILEGVVALLATALVGLLARKRGANPERRLEWVGASYMAVTIVGVLCGWFWLPPGVARFMLPRADSLLFPYAFLLIQIYGAKLLESRPAGKRAITFLLVVLAILSPLNDYMTALLIPLMILWLDPRERADRILAAVFGRIRKFMPAISISQFVVTLCGVIILGNFVLLIDSPTQLWNFQIPADNEEIACYDAQLWARDHTPPQSIFMVPPAGCGFRVLSERSSWGEWSDGNAMYFDPAFADTFRKRVAVLIPAEVPQGTGIIDSATDAYRKQPWERIRTVAAENTLDYIVQFSGTQYPAQPVYSNASFQIYKVY